MSLILLIITAVAILLLFNFAIKLADKCDMLLEQNDTLSKETIDAWSLNSEYAKKFELIMQLEREGELDMVNLEIIQGELMTAYNRVVKKGKGDGKQT